MSEIYDDVQTALSKTDNELLIDIGSQLAHGEVSDATHAVPDFRELLRRGNEWFSKNVNSLQHTVCTSSEIKRLSDLASDDSALILAIVDLIASIFVGVSPVTVTAMILKRGLGAYCTSYWDPPEKTS